MTPTVPEAIQPNHCCPVCSTRLHTLLPGKKPMLVDDQEDEDVIVITFCRACRTILQYSVTRDCVEILPRDAIKKLDGTSQFELLKLIAAMG